MPEVEARSPFRPPPAAASYLLTRAVLLRGLGFLYYGYAYQLLRGEPRIKELLARDPFPERPPRFVRARLYRYRFARDRTRGQYWERELEDEYLRPLWLGHPDFRRFLARNGWLRELS